MSQLRVGVGGVGGDKDVVKKTIVKICLGFVKFYRFIDSCTTSATLEHIKG